MARRAQWGRPAEFILTVTGFTVGLSSLWRFPFLCFKNGGAAFLLPYLACLLFLGIPVFALDVYWGQFVGKGPLSVWSVNPVAKGVGIGMVAVLGIFMICNSVLISWAVRYLIASFETPLPWMVCHSCSCAKFNPLDRVSWELVQKCSASAARAPSEVYFSEEVVNMARDIRETGPVQWELMLCNLACWIIVFVVLVRGIRSLGKVSYVTVIVILILMTVLLIRASLLDGAGEGIRHFFKPDWCRLGDAGVWVEAGLQVIFSLGLGTGALIALSSHNDFHNNIIRDALLVPFISTLIHLYASFLVFAILGHAAYLRNTPVGTVMVGGPALAFVVIPEVLGQLPVPSLWAVMFFAMLCLMGFTTQFAAVESFVTSIVDESPTLVRSVKRSLIFRGCLCFGAFLLGLPMVTQAGPLFMEMVERGLFGIPVTNTALFQLLLVGVIYGVDHFLEDVEHMVGRRPGPYFKVCWMVFSPLMLVGVGVFMVFSYRPHPVPLANLAFWIVSVFPVFCTPAFALVYSCKISQITSATKEWWNLRNRGATAFLKDPTTTTTSEDEWHQDKGSCSKKTLQGFDMYEPDLTGNAGSRPKDALPFSSSDDGVANDGYDMEEGGGFREIEFISPAPVSAIPVRENGGTSGGRGGQITRM